MAGEKQSKRRWLKWMVGGLLLLVVGPYVYSRAVSPWVAVKVFEGKGEKAEANEGKFRVGTWNIAHGRGLSESNWTGETREQRLQRLDQIAVELRQANLDVVVLNEVDFNSSWSLGINQAEYLAEKAGFAYRAEQRNMDFAVGWYRWCFGNAVLSRRPIKDVRRVQMPTLVWWEPWLVGQKQALLCSVEVENWKQVQLLGVHLEHRDEQVRVASAQMILELPQAAEGLLCLGDFNSSPVGFPLAELNVGGDTALGNLLNSGRFCGQPITKPQPSDFTFPADRPDRVIDWILSPNQWTLTAQTVGSVQLSDHRPVWAEFNK